MRAERICPDAVELSVNGAKLRLSCDSVISEHTYGAQDFGGTKVVRPGRITNIASAICAGRNGAAELDRLLRGGDATLTPVEALRTVNPEAVRSRCGYLKKDPNPVRLTAPAQERTAGFAPYTRVIREDEAQK